MSIRFIFIEYGNKDIYFQELKYSLMTLKSMHELSADMVWVYTENVSRYEHLPLKAISIQDKLANYSLQGKYHFRIKPNVIKDALSDLPAGWKLVFLDTDTYINQSLVARVSAVRSNLALMNRLEKRNPYPNAVLNDLSLPSGRVYAYSPTETLMYNSGVLGLCVEHMPVLEDAIAITDGMLAAGVNFHTIEQTAVSEAFRIHKIGIEEVHKEVTHYWGKTDKKFMHHQLRKIFEAVPSESYMPTKRIPHNWWLARLSKLLSIG